MMRTEIENILNPNHVTIRKPYYELNREEKKKKSKEKAEVATPHKIVKEMVSLVYENRKKFDATYLEITCGDCPFIADSYDRQTGEKIPLEERSGVLDLKLKSITYESEEEYFDKAERALKSVYGYELDESLLVLGRYNVLHTMIAYTPDIEIPEETYYRWAEIIVRNFIVMNGLTGLDLNGEPARFYDWKNEEYFIFNEIQTREKEV